MYTIAINLCNIIFNMKIRPEKLRSAVYKINLQIQFLHVQ